eukprot:4298261-Ditylum_brightwellii.AAC.1
MCVQFHSQGASKKGPTTNVGDKIRSMIVKLQETYGNKKLSISAEDGTLIQLETTPKKAME